MRTTKEKKPMESKQETKRKEQKRGEKGKKKIKKRKRKLNNKETKRGRNFEQKRSINIRLTLMAFVNLARSLSFLILLFQLKFEKQLNKFEKIEKFEIRSFCDLTRNEKIIKRKVNEKKKR